MPWLVSVSIYPLAAGYSEWMEAAVQHFKYFDKDTSGEIEPAEFVELYANLKTHGYPLDSIEVAKGKMDADKDGKISLPEYCQWLSDIKFG
jgi:Ca2+-binding EF-hand superfamily protein